MKKSSILLTLALLAVTGFAFKAMAEGDKKESPIGQVMKDHFKGDTSTIKKAAKGEASKEEIAKLVAALKVLQSEKASKGEASSWKEKTDALVLAGEKLEKGEAGAGEALKTAANCKACHDVHREKK